MQGRVEVREWRSGGTVIALCRHDVDVSHLTTVVLTTQCKKRSAWALTAGTLLLSFHFLKMC